MATRATVSIGGTEMPDGLVFAVVGGMCLVIAVVMLWRDKS
jgi:hypothetical protein